MKSESIAKTINGLTDNNLKKRHQSDKANSSNSPPVTDAISDTSDSSLAKKKLAIDKLASRSELYIALGVIFLYVALFFAGRRYWDERYYIAEEGLGYFMGLTGGIIMLLAMIYSVFKYAPSLRKRIKMKSWLNIHIAFGLLGPLLIYFHSTFHIGSLNGGIALISMSLVLLSGIMGRFLYSKTHYGLGGRKAQLSELHAMLNDENNHFHSAKLNNFTQSVMKHSTSLLIATWELVSYPIHSRWIYLRVSREMIQKLMDIAREKNLTAKQTRKYKRDLKKNLRAYLALLHKVALFKLYERFFAFWRKAHVPLLYLLLVSGIVHVFAVHLYSS